jgi:hypothetical protein
MLNASDQIMLCDHLSVSSSLTGSKMTRSYARPQENTGTSSCKSLCNALQGVMELRPAYQSRACAGVDLPFGAVRPLRDHLMGYITPSLPGCPAAKRDIFFFRGGNPLKFTMCKGIGACYETTSPDIYLRFNATLALAYAILFSAANATKAETYRDHFSVISAWRFQDTTRISKADHTDKLCCRILQQHMRLYPC